METVVVTGFGPFGNFPINASWETVKELKNLDFKTNGINLVTEEISVIYSTVLERVPQLWAEYQPKLVVHIGVSAYAKELTLETCAHRDGYERLDIEGQTPDPNRNPNSPTEVRTCLDLEEVATQFNATNNGDVSCILSRDAGRYLCEFIYYTSLCVQPERTVFIHVPDLNRPYSAAQMALGIQQIILLLVDQIKVKCPK